MILLALFSHSGIEQHPIRLTERGSRELNETGGVTGRREREQGRGMRQEGGLVMARSPSSSGLVQIRRFLIDWFQIPVWGELSS